MKYTLKKLAPSFAISFGIIVITLVLYLFSTNAIEFSDSEMNVTKHRMQVDVNDDGSIYIKEDVTLELDSYWNYVIKDIGFAKDESVEEDLGFSIDNARSSFDESSFICNVYLGDKEVKTKITKYTDLDQSKFRSFKIESYGNFVTGTKIHYEYRILNAVTVYNDVAELNWILIDYWDYLTSDIDIDINLPNNTKIDSIQFFGHGVSRNNAVKQNGTNFDIDFDKLHKEELVEVRILFDKSSLINVDEDKVVRQDAKDKILAIEKDIDKEQAKLRKMYNTSKSIVLGSFVLMIALVIYKAIIVYKKFDKERKSEFDSEYYRELPNSYSPAEMGMLVNFNELNKNELEATLLDLIRRKYIILDQNGSTTLDSEPNYKLILNIEKDQSELKSHEKYLLKWFFENISGGNELTLNQLDEYLKSEGNANKYLRNSKEWGRKVLEESSKQDFFDDVRKAKNHSGLAIFFAFLVAFAAFIAYYATAFYEGLIIVGIAISIGIIFSSYVAQIKRRSEKGNEDYVRWMAFKNFLLEFSNFDDYPMPSIIIWEHYLVYATEFGIADLVEEQMRLKFKKMDLNINEYIEVNNSSYMRYHFSCYYFHRRIHRTTYLARNTIQQAQAARAAARGGSSSGGFGGGRSFGGGGGGMRGGR